MVMIYVKIRSDLWVCIESILKKVLSIDSLAVSLCHCLSLVHLTKHLSGKAEGIHPEIRPNCCLGYHWHFNMTFETHSIWLKYTFSLHYSIMCIRNIYRITDSITLTFNMWLTAGVKGFILLRFFLWSDRQQLLVCNSLWY